MTAIWGHRGASVARPENTVEAFLEAKAQQADGVELDVRRSADGALVVHHDAHLPDGRLIAKTSAVDLPDAVPLLEAALDACAGMMVNVEIKNLEGDVDHDPTEMVAGAVVALLADRDGRDEVLVSSFSLATIDRVRSLDPAIRCGYLAGARWDQRRALQRAIDGGHAAFHPYHLVVNAELVAAAHDAGLEVNTWTVDEPDRMRWLVEECGVDGIITNVPDVARRTLG